MEMIHIFKLYTMDGLFAVNNCHYKWTTKSDEKHNVSYERNSLTI